MSMLKETKLVYYHTHEGLKARCEFPFKTKEEYFQWRDEWRKEYAKLSKEIRKLRLSLKDSTLGVGQKANIQSDKCHKRWKASGMMDMRMLAKEHSIRLKKLALKKAA